MEPIYANEKHRDAYDEGWSDGYNDLYPYNPYTGINEELERAWSDGYKQGSMDC